MCALGCSRHLRLAFVSLLLHRDDRSIFCFDRYLELIIVSLFAVRSSFNTERLRALLVLRYVCCGPLVRNSNSLLQFATPSIVHPPHTSPRTLRARNTWLRRALQRTSVSAQAARLRAHVLAAARPNGRLVVEVAAAFASAGGLVCMASPWRAKSWHARASQRCAARPWRQRRPRRRARGARPPTRLPTRRRAQAARAPIARHWARARARAYGFPRTRAVAVAFQLAAHASARERSGR